MSASIIRRGINVRQSRDYSGACGIDDSARDDDVEREEEKREVITISITSTVDHDLLPRLNCFYVYVTADPL